MASPRVNKGLNVYLSPKQCLKIQYKIDPPKIFTTFESDFSTRKRPTDVFASQVQ